MSEPTILSTIETPRLMLRRFVPADAAAVARMCSSDGVQRGTLSLPYPYDEACAATWISGHDEAFANGRYEYAVTDRLSGELYGCVGIFCAAKHGCGELGYWYGPDYWGRGYATEAAQAMIRAAFESWGLHRVYGQHFATNPASGRVMEKCGLRYEGTLRQHLRKGDHYEDVVCRGILKTEWETQSHETP